MPKRVNSILRFLIGVTLIPVCFAVLHALLDTLRSIPSNGSLISSETLSLVGGFMTWMLIWIFLPKPTRAYVAGHELTHAIWGLLCGAKIHRMKINSDDGYVTLSKSNMLITLAPYFFPFYTVCVVVIGLITRCFMNPIPWPHAWLFLIGLTWSFHVCFTLQTLMIRQPDILEYGRLFSYTIIFCLNLLGVALWVLCTTTASFSDFATSLVQHTINNFVALGHATSAFYHLVRAWCI